MMMNSIEYRLYLLVPKLGLPGSCLFFVSYPIILFLLWWWSVKRQEREETTPASKYMYWETSSIVVCALQSQA